jgi:hypothetical protein
MITIKQLIEDLSTLDPNAVIVMSSDSEGNSYSPFAGYYEALYLPRNTWSGEIYTKEDTEYCKEEGISLKKAKKCIVITPTN